MSIYYDYDNTGVQYDWIEINETKKTIRYGNSGIQIPDTHNIECIYVRDLSRLIINNINKYQDISKGVN
ncbi:MULTISPECIES: hypothetical protein [Staphylococcus]|jgi:hypothetical protein|uniref:hypothetical protein n=1 Tax=Staphylococcus TaxID=1279 RepID=UPI0016424B4B|nr:MULTISPECIES: hypothetical protein [Staphylococcus]MBC2921941.1 hypothetical protein [Staphylococcus saprophyticus]MBC2958536.1 hypothetical protein [Staphylococcus saprophyticus]MBC3010381.1 hypothetical protein [Staphylococcus saprophyticus]MBC3024260.1 hypothetical protein [Staphylococcus saprophyticus]MBC3031487.1 hypothetical protein [Staphylococcus saprophyticus]